MDLNLAGVENIINSGITLQSTNNSTDELDLTGVSKLLPTPEPKTSSKSVSDTIKFQPEISDWSLDKLSFIQDYFKQTFNRDLPVSVKGQGRIHNAWNLDHRNSADIGLNPNSKEGQALIQHLRENNIPFLAFSHAFPGVATSAHIHIGRASHHKGNKREEELDLEGIDKIDLDLSGVEDTLKQEEPELALPNSDELNLQDVRIDPSLAIDPSSLDFKKGTKLEYTISHDIAEANKIRGGLHSPNEVGELISTEIDLGTNINTKKRTQKQINDISDAWLDKWNPEYADLNRKFRKETGGLNIALVDDPRNLESLGGGKYKITSRPTSGVQALFEAYKKNGIAGFYTTNRFIDKQIENNNKIFEENKRKIKDYQKNYPYISELKAAGQETFLKVQQLARNIDALPKAIYYGNRYGYNSTQYLEEINKETETGMQLEEAQSSTYQPPTIMGKIRKGVESGFLQLPIYAAAGRFGSSALPLMVYLESYHKGNRQATLESLPMAIMMGGFHGAGEFFKGVNYKNINTVDEFGNMINKTIAIESGGTSAPFRMPFKKITQEDLSLYTKELAKGESTTITNLTPFERQLILRGSNAILMTGTSLITNPHQSASDLAATLTVGLSFPVGKGPREFGINRIAPITPTNISELVKVPFRIGQARIDIPITSPTKYGKLLVLENQRGISPVIYPSSESPNVGKYGEQFDPTKYVSETETGFQAKGQGQTLHLDLDTAALNLIELKRSLKDGTWNKKNAPMQENMQRQNAVRNAIEHLEKVVPQEVQEFFETNEESIRSALKGNNSNQITKQNFIEKGRSLERNPETIKPNEINPEIPTSNDPIVQTKLDEVYKKLGDAGVHNIYTSREAANEKLNNFFKITKQGTFQASPFGIDQIINKSADAAYIGAFYIEDFYRRGIEPKVDLLLNKLRTGLGDYGSKISDAQALTIFNRGMEYYNSNQADPFFSRMKQNIAEELPDRFTSKQANKIIEKTPNAFEEAKGIKEFLDNKSKANERVSKNELIDIINKEQNKQINKTLLQDEDFIPNEEKLKNPETGIRNRITSLEGFDEHRNKLVNDINNSLQPTQKIPSGRWTEDNYTKSDKVELVPINWIKQFAEFDRRTTPKYYSDDSLARIKEDISKNGLNEPVILVVGKEDGKVLLSEGNTRLVALEDLGYDQIPVRVLRQSYNENGKSYEIKMKAGEYFPADSKPSEVFYDIPTKTTIENKGTVFNSGLSPDAFIDQAKLLYKGIKEFSEFSNLMIKRFGESVSPFLQDLWIQVKDIYKNTTGKIDDLLDYTKEGDISKEFREGGFVGRKIKTKAGEEYKLEKKKVPYFEWYSLWRGVGLTQLSIDAGEVYNITRGGQRVKNSFESSVLFSLRDANDKVKGGIDQQAADNIWIGNENKRLYSAAELAAGDASIGRPALNKAQIDAYMDVRRAIDMNLDIRMETKLYSMREKASRLNQQLNNATAGTPEWDYIANRLLDLSDSITKVQDHFSELKKSGYISTQRRGSIVGFTEDASGKLYQHFDSFKEADNWIKLQEDNGANPASSKIYNVKKIENLRAASGNLTPGQFEDLIDSAGVNPHALEVEQLRDEIYSRFPSFGYELKRDLVRGYDRNWQFVLESIAHQTETYANSFYSRVAGEEALKKLDSLGLQDKDYKLYQTMQKYIDHEVSSPERTGASAIFGGIRKGVYLFQLGFDINQLYLNAIGQPISQTYSYFGRVEHNGIKLSKGEVESYFLRAGKIVAQYGKRRATGSALIPAEFDVIRDRLIQERVIEPEFNRQLLELESEKTVSAQLPTGGKLKRGFKQLEHWSGIFMRNGELVTRTHAAAEAFLVGKEKFKLEGEDLVNFIVRAVDATQTNPTRAEAPLIIRGSQNQGELRKLLYQFNAFNHMWLENLALNIRADLLQDQYGGFKKGNYKLSAKNTTRHLAPLILMGGLRGLPLAGIISTLYTLITNDDPKKHFDKLLGKDTFVENLALNGVTTSPVLGQILTPGIPFVDQLKVGDTLGETIDQTLSPSNLLPAVSTGEQIAKGFSDLLEGNKLRAAGELLPFKPLRNIATSLRYNNEGIKTRKGKTIVPRSRVTSGQKFVQIVPGLQPKDMYEYYRKQQIERVKRLRSKLKKI